MNNPMDPHEIGGAPFHNLPSSSQVLQSLLAAGSSPSFHEPSMVDFGGIRRRRRRSEAEPDDGEADEEEEEEEEELGRRRSEKKRRLSATQVQYLEKSFEVENKLEPERKNQLAKELNLQPRQVAIWFQNRRARFKTKQLEKDYGVLKSSFDSLKSHYDDLLMEKDQLQNEVSLLKAKLKLKETSNSDSSIQTEAPLALVKQEEASSVKSDVVDSESPNSTSPEGSDFSQEDLAGSFMPVAADDYGFGKVEEGDFQGGSCSGFGVPGLEGHPSYWPWLY